MNSDTSKKYIYKAKGETKLHNNGNTLDFLTFSTSGYNYMKNPKKKRLLCQRTITHMPKYLMKQLQKKRSLKPINMEKMISRLANKNNVSFFKSGTKRCNLVALIVGDGYQHISSYILFCMLVKLLMNLHYKTYVSVFTKKY